MGNVIQIPIQTQSNFVIILKFKGMSKACLIPYLKRLQAFLMYFVSQKCTTIQDFLFIYFMFHRKMTGQNVISHCFYQQFNPRFTLSNKAFVMKHYRKKCILNFIILQAPKSLLDLYLKGGDPGINGNQSTIYEKFIPFLQLSVQRDFFFSRIKQKWCKSDYKSSNQLTLFWF